MASTLPPSPPDDQPQLADMVRILDVAAEMRADREMASRELAVDETKRLLRERLLESAKLTGDGATPEEIDAAIENYYQSLYTFREPRWNLSVALAHLYVRRGKLALATAGLALTITVGWLLFNSHSGLLSPTARLTNKLQAELHDIESLATKVAKETDDSQATALIQEQLSRLHAAAEKRDLAGVEAVRPRLIQLEKQASELKATLRELQMLTAALKKGTDDPQATVLIQEQLARLGVATEKRDLQTMKDVQQQLLKLEKALDEAYEIRVVSDPKNPKVRSAIEHFYEDKTGKRVSGYYLIVQAKTPDGRVLPHQVTDAETGETQQVTTWGESVPDEVYERLKADKLADGILDETLFAVKKRGELTPQIVMKGASADGAARRQITRIELPARQ